MFERFTERARALVGAAADEARRREHPAVAAEHLLLALLADEDSLAVRVLRDAGADLADLRARAVVAVSAADGTSRPFDSADAAALREIGIDLDAVRAAVERAFGAGALQPPAPPRRSWWRRQLGGTFNPQARKILELSLREALRLRHRHIGTEHILLAMVRDGRGAAAETIVAAGVDPTTLDQFVLNALRPAA
jgi:ATP-dependent Clp protease ATP-binding subunit ClpA